MRGSRWKKRGMNNKEHAQRQEGGMNLKKNGGNKMERMSVKLETLLVMTQSQDFKGFDTLRSNSSVSMLS